MKPIIYLVAVTVAAILYCLIPHICYAQDPGVPDTLIIDTVSVPYDSVNYSTRHIPIYFFTDDSVCFVYMCLKINSPDTMIFWGQRVWRTPFNQWDDVYDTVLISQNAIRTVLFCDMGGSPNPPLFTDRQRLWGADFRIMISPQAQPQFAWIDSMGSIEFGGEQFGFVTQFQRGYVRYGGVSGIDNQSVTPTKYQLLQNYPNPFNSQTAIEFELSQPSPVNLEIFNLTGAKIATLIDQEMAAGRHNVVWDAAEYPSGMYFYRLVAREYHQTEKMLLLR